ncbi:TOMM precursor leader peptide-binding protein [Oscillatoria salina]|uniref:TOMM precursor leader peptide-binding protein n=1 Tax=Oscillatoria salina TaxID=331517 RepID=UPI0013B9C791|nr:TOMM precursor leader peptide-binding protein [Oscillatoria salina]MBZ8181372.1 TOMM precursor leader peptide-binding protein [Oscillatoria salina IIICB1]NET88327.1 TOMM precursor leader peptide-binding protein [Kamptonema sp. SIO1D9]
MLKKPKFKNHFHVEVREPKLVYLLSEKGHFVLRGRLYVLLAPFLNGSYTIAEIVQQLQGKATAEEINYGLRLLQNKGYITEAEPNLPPSFASFWHLLDLDSSTTLNSLKSAQVTVTNISNIPTEPFIYALKSLNINLSEEGDLTVVLTDDYLQPELAIINQKALLSGKPWLLVKPVGAVLWIGPIFVPNQTGCWQCLRQRLQMNREIESSLQQEKGILRPFPVSRSALPPTIQIGFNLAATEIAKWLVGAEEKQLLGKIITFDLVSLSLEHHQLIRRPQCLKCGSKNHLKPQPLLLKSQPKLDNQSGGYRSCSPQETWQKYTAHLSPITGVVRKIFNPLPQENSLIHVYLAEHNFPKTGHDLDSLQRALRRKSAGKGQTDWQAKVSCLGEAIERYSGIYTGQEMRVKATYSQLRDDAIAPDKFLLYSEQQYQKRQEWNQINHPIQWIPEPFNPEQEIEWTPVWSLTAEKFKYLPTAYCYYGYFLPKEQCFCWADTNGNAAGNCLEEAILQGFLELVERDAVALWWYNRVKRPAVNLASFGLNYLDKVKEYYQSLGRDFWVLDLTSDLNIPTFAAISHRNNRQPEDILFGFGCHFNPKIAILRAVAEMNQMVFLSGAADPEGRAIFSREDMQSWCEMATVANQPYLVADETVKAKVYRDYLEEESFDLREDVMKCVNIAAERGLETLVLDLTRPDIKMSVVKLIVPGLRHFWAQFAPGRLYEVPVKLGWLEEPLKEEWLNPIPMFI